MYYIYQQKQILLGLWTCDNLQTKYNKKHDKHSTIANHNNCPTNFFLIPAEPALDNVMCPPTSEVCQYGAWSSGGGAVVGCHHKNSKCHKYLFTPYIFIIMYETNS